MTWDRVERLIGQGNLRLLSEKRVGIIGLGSGGGFVAQSLAMSGVGHFVLVDDDTLELGNVVRHAADRRDVGREKVDVMADLIKLRNPEAEVQTYKGFVEQHLDVLDDLDILAVCVDGEQTKYQINQACLERNLIAVYAGVYERGEGGDVVTIHPYDGPCYDCWAAELREGVADPKAPQELDYGMIGPDKTLAAEPGLWLDVVRIASIQADFVLNELLRGTDVYHKFPANTVIFANRAIEIVDGEVTPPYTAVWAEIARDPECLVCGDRMRVQSDADSTDILSIKQLTDAMGIQLDNDEQTAQDQSGG